MDQNLNEAAFYGNRGRAEKALNDGADIYATDRYGESALTLAASQGHGDVVSLLINHNAEIDFQNTEDGNSALHLASQNGFLEIAEILIKNGANIDLRNKNGWTPLITAVALGRNDLVKMLIRCGADISVTDKRGKQALDLARDRGNNELIALLTSAL